MCFEPKKQRTLGILDSELNQNNKRIGKDAINIAFRLKNISQKEINQRKAGIDQIISKWCLLDHNYSTCSSFSLTSSNLADYYDHIVHTAAAMSLLRVSIPHSRIYSMFDFIQKMINITRAAYGNSEVSDGGDDIGK